jgi:hypothetical protein
MTRKPKKVVKKRKAKKVNPRMVPHGVVTGRVSSRTFDLESHGFTPGDILHLQFPVPSKPLHKMSKKEVIELLQKERDNHKTELREREKAHERAIMELKLKFTQTERDNYFRHTNELIEVILYGSKEAKFPRSC